MAHSSELRWQGAADAVASQAFQTLRALNDAEQTYQDLLEAYTYAGGTDQAFADLLFQEVNGNPDPIADTATAEQVALVADLSLAIQALHELYQAADNQVVAQEDRLTQLRRMS